MKFSDPLIKSWVEKGEPIAGRSDRGLTFRLTKEGKASWYHRYRFGDKQRWYFIGNYPKMTLGKARKEVKKLMAKTDEVDISAVRREERIKRRSVETFKELSEAFVDYLESQVGEKEGVTPRTLEERKRYLKKDIYPALGNLSIDSITPADILDLVERVGRRSASVGRETFTLVSLIFSYGVSIRLAENNPCVGLNKRYIVGRVNKNKPKKKRLMLDESELKVFFGKLPTLGRSHELMFKILLLTGVRKSELVFARLDSGELDLLNKVWTIPEDRHGNKSKREFRVPLPEVAVGWFEELVAMAGNDVWLLPGRSNGHLSDSTVNKVIKDHLCEIDGLRCFSPHDLRSTMRSWLSELGTEPIVAERCLNHSLGGLMAVYDQSDFIDQRRIALQKWADKILEIESGKKQGNVVPLHA